MFFQIYIERWREPLSLKSVDVPIRDFNTCIKEYQEYAKEINESIPFGVNYIHGMSICAGELGKDGCDVRFIMQISKTALIVHILEFLCRKFQNMNN